MIDRVGDALAEGGLWTLLGFVLVFSGCFLLFAWHMTRPQDGRTGVHRNGADEARESTTAQHRKYGKPGETTRVLRYDNAVARARVMKQARIDGGETQMEAKEPDAGDPVLRKQDAGKASPVAGWFYDMQPDQIVLFSDTGKRVRVISGDEYATHKARVDAEVSEAGLPTIPDVIPYIEWQGRVIP